MSAARGTRRRSFLFLLSVFLLALGRAALAAAASEPGVAYETKIEGVEDKNVAALLHDNAKLVTLQDNPPPSVAALRRRGEADLPRLLQILQSEGYWAGQIDLLIDESKKPVTVTVRVTPGPLYHFAAITLRTPEGERPPLAEKFDLAAAGLAESQPARAIAVTSAESNIVTVYHANGHPLAKIADREVTVDDGTQTVNVALVVAPGPEARFGKTNITGLHNLNPAYVAARIAWQEGDLYDERKVTVTRQTLIDSNLFSIVDIQHGEEAPDNGMPINLALTERPSRTVGAGVEYSTTLGVGLNLFWENRNLFGNAEDLRVNTQVAESQLGVSALLRRPDFLARNQDLLVGADLADETPPAYTSRHLVLRTALERHLNPTLLAGLGVSFERATLSAVSGPSHYHLIGLPIYVKSDTTGTLLDPVRGTRAGLEVTPYRGLGAQDPSFVSTRLSASYYHPILEPERLVAAGFLRIGSIFGARRDDIPADKRFYLGGGGSIRGYSYQRVGPLLRDQPVGGRSSLEFGGELRIKVTDSIGIVPFAEAGNVYAQPLPKFSGRLFIGAGIGLRYYTPIGPVRLDLATPVSPRRANDGPIQVYISLGQSF